MSIGLLADHFGLATHVLRHWESMGLLTPARDAAGRRRYGPADLTRVALILSAKDAGLSLENIAVLTPATDPAKRRDVLRKEAEALRSRIAAAQASLELLEGALDCDHEDFTQCPNFERMLAERVEGARSQGDGGHGQADMAVVSGSKHPALHPPSTH
ncbi:MerR family transcriptional regulator [Actinomadura livida]|uniref:DNA-binding transcriptional MerR regulator n=1 Tax=Actinomadura livida TaxID=79909 RepID=A0A7W7I997_9ACTN|nr:MULTISPECIES: MerR family transcriptional regulator [Actinomadura]MBB4772877.1 DNA-binding transcriptional MerR regulator [Actinomadura catellatispora]GGU13359.1 MerR family transcriptional regulator [Actinomadura livida]